MSKYVRTKDNCIYKVVKENDYIFEVDTLNSYCDNAYDIFIDKKVVIKQSETIEELCDCFVSVHKVLGTEIFKHKELNKIKEEIKNGSPVGELYGALCLESGLKFVAKLNGKGELELI